MACLCVSILTSPLVCFLLDSGQWTHPSSSCRSARSTRVPGRLQGQIIHISLILIRRNAFYVYNKNMKSARAQHTCKWDTCYFFLSDCLVKNRAPKGMCQTHSYAVKGNLHFLRAGLRQQLWKFALSSLLHATINHSLFFFAFPEMIPQPKTVDNILLF